MVAMQRVLSLYRGWRAMLDKLMHADGEMKAHSSKKRAKPIKCVHGRPENDGQAGTLNFIVTNATG
jgi:hypothetical protein